MKYIKMEGSSGTLCYGSQIMTFSLAHIIQWLIGYKYFVLFPIAVAEGPIVTILAGFLASQGKLGFFTAYIVIVSGDLVGDSIYYAIGRFARRSAIERWGYYVGITPEKIERLTKHFQNNSGKTFLIGKITNVLGVIILVAAGLVKMPFKKFSLYNIVITLPKSLMLLLIGFYFGQAYVRINKYLNSTALAILVIIVLFILIYVVSRVFAKRIYGKDQPLS